MTVLLERESALKTLRETLRAAAVRGHVALVAGEAGIGKTSVLRALAEEHAHHGPVWWGVCDALETPNPLAPLLDIARESKPRFATALSGPRQALFEAVLDDLRHAAAPILMIVEDAHWADDATLDLLKFLGRRIERAHAVLAISYRDDEVGASHPLRRVLGELPLSHRSLIEVPRLTREGVGALALRYGGRTEGVYEATRGNAFFATEVLRDTSVPRAAVPRTVQDVVLARFARLAAPVRSLLQLVAIVPGRTERWLVDALLAPSVADLEAALSSGLLLADGTNLKYRHELGRVAVETSLSPPLAQDLHRRVLAALENGPATPLARLVHHAVGAQDREAISRLAPRAADEAAARGAHREAAAQWRLALAYGTPLDAAQHRHWLDNCALECAIVGQAAAALESRRALERMARERGDIADAAVQLSRQANLHIGQMRHEEADRLSREAIALLDPLPPGRAHAFVWRIEAYLRMLDRDVEDSAAWARRAADLAATLGDEAAAVAARGALGTALLFIDYPAGVDVLQQTLKPDLVAGRLQQAAVTLGNLGSGSGEVMQLANAERWLREAADLSVANEFDNQAWYSRAWLALVQLQSGRWPEAGDLATTVMAQEGIADMSRLMALLALARLRIRRGDPGAEKALDAGIALTGSHNTLQRIAPLRAVRAEAAIARGDPAGAADEINAALSLAQAKRHPWFIGELAYWGWRAGVVSEPPPGTAEPYALEMTGCWSAAAVAWKAIGCPYEQARALAQGDPQARQAALAIFEALGARPAVDELRRRLREAGVRGIARGARASTRSNPAGLTETELQVLELLCQDLRNAEIARKLHRSVRTIDHHVAAVLSKLGVDSRLEAVRRAEREGWVGRIGPNPAN